MRTIKLCTRSKQLRLQPFDKPGFSPHFNIFSRWGSTSLRWTSGQRLNLADGDFTTWTQRLLSNAKERLLVSGMGIELLVKLFR